MTWSFPVPDRGRRLVSDGFAKGGERSSPPAPRRERQRRRRGNRGESVLGKVFERVAIGRKRSCVRPRMAQHRRGAHDQEAPQIAVAHLEIRPSRSLPPEEAKRPGEGPGPGRRRTRAQT